MSKSDPHALGSDTLEPDANPSNRIDTAECKRRHRNSARELLQHSIPQSAWHHNARFVQQVKSLVQNSQLLRHPMLEALYQGEVKLVTLRQIHLEYRHAIVQIFADALLMCAWQARQINGHSHGASDLQPRFLLTLNLLDEFGFCASHDTPINNTRESLYQQMMRRLNISEDEQLSYSPTAEACYVRDILMRSYHHYPQLLCLLAVAEEQILAFSPALKSALQQHGIDVSGGYYQACGATTALDTPHLSHDHVDDLWLCLQQAGLDCDQEELMGSIRVYLSGWDQFWTRQFIDCHLADDCRTPEVLV